jgi:hypothetical protein
VSSSIEALAVDLATIEEARIRALVEGRIVRKTVASISTNWVTCTDGTKVAILMGPRPKAGDDVYLGNVSDTPKRPTYFVIGTQEVDGATIRIGEELRFVNHYSPVGTTDTTAIASAVLLWAAGSIPTITLPSGTFTVEIDTTINFSRDVGSGGLVFDQRLTGGASQGGRTFRNYAGYHYPARLLRTWTGFAGGGSPEMQIAWRGNETAGTTRIHDLVQFIRAIRTG